MIVGRRKETTQDQVGEKKTNVTEKSFKLPATRLPNKADRHKSRARVSISHYAEKK